MTCGHWYKAYSPFANLSRDEVRALAKTSLTELYVETVYA
jgi:hypothetical protein